MTVGQTLTEARAQAGLTVDELSERTRIRGTVIRSIEQDDYEACGGDLYVRGYVRALAGAVGIDAQPLIREYELGRAGQGSERANGSTGRHAKGYPAVAEAPTAFDLPAVPEAPTAFDLPAVTAAGQRADPSTTRFDLPSVSDEPVFADPAATAFDLPAVPPVPPAEVPPAAAQPPGSADTRFDLPPVTGDLMAAGYDLAAQEWPGQPDDLPQAWPGQPGDSTAVMPALGSSPPPRRTSPARLVTRGSAPGSPVPRIPMQRAAAAVPSSRRSSGWSPWSRSAPSVFDWRPAARRLAARRTPAPRRPARRPPRRGPAPRRRPARRRRPVRARPRRPVRVPRRRPARRRRPVRAPRGAVTRLPVAAAVAFGPDGPADGDDPGNAQAAISGGASQPWSTQWYATPEFGMLKHGTGLLLDMGGKVTVTRVVIDLSNYGGASLEIRAGNGTAPQDLRVAAAASNAGGVLRLTLPHPVTARYLLIWLTKLPPDGSGHYAETISHVQVTGRR